MIGNPAGPGLAARTPRLVGNLGVWSLARQRYYYGPTVTVTSESRVTEPVAECQWHGDRDGDGSGADFSDLNS